LIEKMAKDKTDKFLDKYKIDSNRLSGHDYSGKAKYFVTIEAFQMKEYFGKIVQTCQGTSPNEDGSQIKETRLGASVLLSTIGQIAFDNWNAIPKHFPFVELDAFQIMPNHIHGILFFNTPTKNQYWPNRFETTKGSLGTVLNLYKGSITKFANLHNIEFKWHPRYHDIIIRDPKALDNIRNYIISNPKKWLEKYGTKK
jgi:putative transposase